MYIIQVCTEFSCNSVCLKLPARNSVPQREMGLMKSTKDAVCKVRQYVSSKLKIS